MRALLLNVAASAAMALLLAALALRAWTELLGQPCPAALRGWTRPESPEREESGRALPGWAVGLLSLVALWLGAALAYLMLRRGGKSAADFFALWWERFTVAGDAPHYLYLAEHGYASAGEKINLIVFYPLYPFLMGLLGRALGGAYALAGVLISQGAYALSAVVLWRMARRDTPHPAWALAAYWLYPFGFFAMGIFTEGLFLLLSLGCLDALREEKWRRAGLLGFLCLLCRAQGMALLPAGLYAVWHSARRHGAKRAMWWLLALPAGWGVYLLLNRVYAGGFFAFRLYESLPPWWQTTQWLGRTIAQQVEMALQYPFLGTIIYWPQLLLYFAAAALLLALLRRQAPTELAVHAVGYLGMCYLAGWLISGGRYMLGCAGLYFAVGSFRRRGAAATVLAIEALAAVWFWVNFMDGQSIM